MALISSSPHTCAKTYHPSDTEELISVIESSKPGDIVVLPEGKLAVRREINVPSYIVIRGRENSILDAHSNTFLFRLSAETKSVKLLNFKVILSKGGFVLGEGVEDVLVSNITVKGNILGRDTSGMAIRFSDSQNVEVSDSNITETYGGVYLTNTNASKVLRNSLGYVTYGNIAVSGKDIVIKGNSIEYPGTKPAKRADPNGDGITLGLVDDVVIDGNYILKGGCYGIWAYTEGSRNIQIINNVVQDGITAGVLIQNATNVLVENNLLSNNVGPGVSFFPVENGQVLGNKFVNDEFRNFSKSKNINLKENSFTLPTSKAVLHSLDLIDGEKSNNLFSVDERIVVGNH